MRPYLIVYRCFRETPHTPRGMAMIKVVCDMPRRSLRGNPDGRLGSGRDLRVFLWTESG
jgi:hypothetical protein